MILSKLSTSPFAMVEYDTMPAVCTTTSTLPNVSSDLAKRSMTSFSLATSARTAMAYPLMMLARPAEAIASLTKSVGERGRSYGTLDSSYPRPVPDRPCKRSRSLPRALRRMISLWHRFFRLRQAWQRQQHILDEPFEIDWYHRTLWSAHGTR